MRTIRVIAAACLALAAGGCAAEPAPSPAALSMHVPVRTSPWEGPSVRGRQLRTEHYAIFTTVEAGETIEALPGFLEAARRRYLQLLSLPDRPQDKPMPVYFLATRAEWASLTRTVAGEQAAKYLQIEHGGYCRQGVCVFWAMGGQGAFQVAAHEGLHQYVSHRLADQLPMWLEEGLCTQMEACDMHGGFVTFDPRKNLSRRADLERALLHGYWIPVDRLLPMDAGDAVGGFVERAVGYYGQLWALVQFLRSRPKYSAGLDRLLADAEAGRFHEALGVPKGAPAQLRLRGRIYNQAVSEKLFRHYICDDLRAFEREYKAFCLRLTELG